MLPLLFGVIARLAIAVGLAFILSKSLPRLPNKAYRFIFLFALLVLFNFGGNYVDVWLLGYHTMSWTAAVVIALFIATPLTLWPPIFGSSDQ